MDGVVRSKVEFESACPDCGSEWFNPGPQGGQAQCIRCVGCGSKFSFGPPFAPRRIDIEDRFFNPDVKCKTDALGSGAALRAFLLIFGNLIQ